MSLPVKNPIRPLQANGGRLLRLPAVCELTGLRRSMIYMLESEKRFPQRIKLTARAVAWLEGEVREWIANRIEQTRNPQGNPKHAQNGVAQRALDLPER